MKITCDMADDLLPLYLENACSADSRAALEEHLRTCGACREKLERMRSDAFRLPGVREPEEIQMAGYAKKVARRRVCFGVLIVLASILAACALSLLFLTFRDLQAQKHPAVHAVEEGVCQLTAGDLETTAAEVGSYILYTNYEQIVVRIQGDQPFDGQILLWDATDREKPEVILYGSADPDSRTCVFSNLSAARRYAVTCEGGEEVELVVSEGRTVSFWSSLENVVRSLLAMAAD